MQKLIFKKGISTINIPFLLSKYQPWQDSITQELEKCQKRFKVAKSASWGYEITEHGATIKVYKDSF